MYGGVRQCGFISVLQSFGSSPLELWELKVQNGYVRRVTDEQVRALALEITGTNVSTCYIYCPKDPRLKLGIHMPYLVMIIKNMKKYFTFEITILDDKNVHRRFRLSNFQRLNKIHHFGTSLPLCLSPGWNEIYFDLHDFVRKAYKTNYVETTRLQIHANCRIRVIYFCDRIYEPKDIPQKYKIFLPCSHVCNKKSQEEISERKDEFDDMYLEEKDGYEDAEMYLRETLSIESMPYNKDEQKEGIIEEKPEFLIGDDHEEDLDGFDDLDEDEDDGKRKQAESPEEKEAIQQSEGILEEPTEVTTSLTEVVEDNK